MSLIIKKAKQDGALKSAVEKTSGVDINACLQCKKCTNGCPVADMVDTPPSDIIRQLQLNTGDDILKRDLVWMCASCETCFSRCPMQIDMASVMDALRILAAKKIVPAKVDKVNRLNKAFLKTVKMFGRTYDIGMIAAYKLKTRNLLQDTDKFPAMLGKRKIALFPNFGADKKYVKRIFKRLKTKNKG